MLGPLGNDNVFVHRQDSCKPERTALQHADQRSRRKLVAPVSRLAPAGDVHHGSPASPSVQCGARSGLRGWHCVCHSTECSIPVALNARRELFGLHRVCRLCNSTLAPRLCGAVPAQGRNGRRLVPSSAAKSADSSTHHPSPSGGPAVSVVRIRGAFAVLGDLQRRPVYHGRIAEERPMAAWHYRPRGRGSASQCLRSFPLQRACALARVAARTRPHPARSSAWL